MPGTRDLVLRDAPDRGHVRSRRGVVDLPVAGKLVRLLAVLAASLAVPLTGDRAEAGERLAASPKGEREIDEREDVVDALRLLLGAARREHHRASRLGEQRRGTHELCFGDAGDLLDALGPVGGEHAAQLLEPLGALAHEVEVHGAALHEQVQETVGDAPRRSPA